MNGWRLEFAGGGILRGSATQVIDAWGAMTFGIGPGLAADMASGDYEDLHEKARMLLADRAYVWDGTVLPLDGSDDEFLTAIAASGLVALYEEEIN